MLGPIVNHNDFVRHLLRRPNSPWSSGNRRDRCSTPVGAGGRCGSASLPSLLGNFWEVVGAVFFPPPSWPAAAAREPGGGRAGGRAAHVALTWLNPDVYLTRWARRGRSPRRSGRRGGEALLSLPGQHAVVHGPGVGAVRRPAGAEPTPRAWGSLTCSSRWHHAGASAAQSPPGTNSTRLGREDCVARQVRPQAAGARALSSAPTEPTTTLGLRHLVVHGGQATTWSRLALSRRTPCCQRRSRRQPAN